MAIAQLMLNSMRQQHSKWKLMMRTHRAPCVINQHVTEDVCSRALYLISRTERRTFFMYSLYLQRHFSEHCLFLCWAEKSLMLLYSSITKLSNRWKVSNLSMLWIRLYPLWLVQPETARSFQGIFKCLCYLKRSSSINPDKLPYPACFLLSVASSLFSFKRFDSLILFCICFCDSHAVLRYVRRFLLWV